MKIKLTTWMTIVCIQILAILLHMIGIVEMTEVEKMFAVLVLFMSYGFYRLFRELNIDDTWFKLEWRRK